MQHTVTHTHSSWRRQRLQHAIKKEEESAESAVKLEVKDEVDSDLADDDNFESELDSHLDAQGGGKAENATAHTAHPPEANVKAAMASILGDVALEDMEDAMRNITAEPHSAGAARSMEIPEASGWTAQEPNSLSGKWFSLFDIIRSAGGRCIVY